MLHLGTLVRRGKCKAKFLQYNAHRSSNASTSLRRKLIGDEIDVLFIQEPQVNKQGEICGLPKGKLVFKPGEGENERPGSGVWLEQIFENPITLNQFLSRDVGAATFSAIVDNTNRWI